MTRIPYTGDAIIPKAFGIKGNINLLRIVYQSPMVGEAFTHFVAGWRDVTLFLKARSRANFKVSLPQYNFGTACASKRSGSPIGFRVLGGGSDGKRLCFNNPKVGWVGLLFSGTINIG
jgi:hypothetical protein